MITPLRFAGAAALCTALFLTACAKKTDQTTTTSEGTTTQAAADAGATPASGADATAAPNAAATPVAEVSPSTTPGALTVSTVAPAANGGASAGGYIDLPVYPGAAEQKDQDISTSGTDGSVVLKVYATKDDAKTVGDWYKSHLPAGFKGGVLTAGDKTVATFDAEHTDGDQSVMVTGDSPAAGSRIQLATKHNT